MKNKNELKRSWNYHNGVSEKMLEVVSESTHEIGIALDGCSTFENRECISAK